MTTTLCKKNFTNESFDSYILKTFTLIYSLSHVQIQFASRDRNYPSTSHKLVKLSSVYIKKVSGVSQNRWQKYPASDPTQSINFLYISDNTLPLSQKACAAAAEQPWLADLVHILCVTKPRWGSMVSAVAMSSQSESCWGVSVRPPGGRRTRPPSTISRLHTPPPHVSLHTHSFASSDSQRKHNLSGSSRFFVTKTTGDGRPVIKFAKNCFNSNPISKTSPSIPTGFYRVPHKMPQGRPLIPIECSIISRQNTSFICFRCPFCCTFCV